MHSHTVVELIVQQYQTDRRIEATLSRQGRSCLRRTSVEG